MIFVQWEQVIGLKEPVKTQARWPVKEGEECKDGFTISKYWYRGQAQSAHDISHGLTYPAAMYPKWQVGRIYAIQRPDKKTVGHFELAKIRRERLGDISAKDIFAEGIGIYNPVDGQWYPITVLDVAREEYAQLWEVGHGRGSWERMKDSDVWVLEWRVVERSDG